MDTNARKGGDLHARSDTVTTTGLFLSSRRRVPGFRGGWRAFVSVGFSGSTKDHGFVFISQGRDALFFFF